MKDTLTKPVNAVNIRLAQTLSDAGRAGAVFAEAFANDEYWQWASRMSLK